MGPPRPVAGREKSGHGRGRAGRRALRACLLLASGRLRRGRDAPFPSNSTSSRGHVTRPASSARSSAQQRLTLEPHLREALPRNSEKGSSQTNPHRQTRAPGAGRATPAARSAGLRHARRFPRLLKSQCLCVCLCLQVSATLWPK